VLLRVGFLALLVAALASGVAFASILSPFSESSSERSQPRAERSDSTSARAGSQEVGATAANPRGGKPFGVLVYRNAEGERCAALGEVQGDRVGAYGHDENGFTELPLDKGGTCGLNPQPLTFNLERAAIEGGRTTIWGIARSDVERIRISVGRGQGARVIQPAESGAYIAVLGGQVTAETTIIAETASGDSEPIVVPARPPLEDMPVPSMDFEPEPHEHD
jgi:hypothetical protein